MKKYAFLLAFGFSIQFSAHAQKNGLEQFAFLLGNWQMKTPKGKITESWIKDKNSLHGKSYRHNLSGDSVLTETIIIKNTNGQLYFCVTGLEKNNTGTTNFKLISTQDSTFIFENKAHDFPQRISYKNQGKMSLLAWIEGVINGKKMKSEFPYQRKE